MANPPCIHVKQPIGEFFLTVLPAQVVARRVEILRRTTSIEDKEKVQRSLSDTRVSEIARYVGDPDATFPTPIIIAATSERVQIKDSHITFPDEGPIGEVIDGQHRIEGMRRSMDMLKEFELPIVVMMDLSSEEKAYVFSIINSKQTPVSKSLIYDLFGLSDQRTAIKTCHEIARAMNADPSGPFYKGLKMLGRKEGDMEFLTQGSFVKYLVKLITKSPDVDALKLKKGEAVERDPSLPFNAYWHSGKDEVILRIMTNYFTAIRDVFQKEWSDDPEKYVLRRTVGYAALMKAFGVRWNQAKDKKDASYSFFLGVAKSFQENRKKIELTGVNFDSSGGGVNRLADLLLDGKWDRA